MLVQKIIYFYLFLIPIFIFQSTTSLNAMVMSYQIGILGAKPTPQSLKAEIQTFINTYKKEISLLKSELKIEINSDEKTNSLLALLLILTHEITRGEDKYLYVLMENSGEFKDFLTNKDFTYKLLEQAAGKNRDVIAHYIAQSYKSIFQTSIFEKHEIQNHNLVKLLLIHMNQSILQNFIQNGILDFADNLCELRKTAKENQLPEIEKILSRKIWANQTQNFVKNVVYVTFMLIILYLAYTSN